MNINVIIVRGLITTMIDNQPDKIVRNTTGIALNMLIESGLEKTANAVIKNNWFISIVRDSNQPDYQVVVVDFKQKNNLKQPNYLNHTVTLWNRAAQHQYWNEC